MKTFRDNYEPIEVALVNMAGKETVIKSQFLTTGEIKKIEKLSKDKSFETETDRAYAILKIYFGKGEEFFKQFSFDLLAELMNFIREEMNKKKQKTQNGLNDV